MRGRTKLAYEWERPPTDRAISSWERLAYERHERDLREGHLRGLWFDDAAAERAVRFIESFCVHVEGELAGRPFKLSRFQVFIVSVIFGWKRENGLRRYRWAFVQLARKNGKSLLASAIALYLLVADMEPGAQVFSVATKRDQAKVVFNAAAKMVLKGPLDDVLEVFGGKPQSRTDVIACDELGGSFVPLASDADTLDALNAHGVVADELHAWKDRHLWSVLTTSTGARRQSLIFAITTPGVGQSGVCWDIRLHATHVLEGTLPDDSLFAFIAEPDLEAAWDDPVTWQQGNPNLGISVKVDQLEAEAQRAKDIPAEQNAFRRYRCGQWTEQIDRAIPLDLWDACGGTINPRILHGRVCYGGLDLASTTDLAAFALMFETWEAHPWHYLLTYPFLPGDGLEERERREMVPLTKWRDEGHLIVTQGNEISYATIRDTIKKAGREFAIEEIGHDPWNATGIIQDLREVDGFTTVPVTQGVGGMSAPTKEFLHLLRSGRLRHGDQPVLRWGARNLALWEDTNANIKPSRKASGGRIDPVVAAIIATDRTMRHADSTSIYETRGLG